MVGQDFASPGRDGGVRYQPSAYLFGDEQGQIPEERQGWS